MWRPTPLANAEKEIRLLTINLGGSDDDMVCTTQPYGLQAASIFAVMWYARGHSTWIRRECVNTA